jgi:hypothetical protein
MRLVACLVTASALIACSSSSPRIRDVVCTDLPSLVSDADTHALKTVFVILLENKDWSRIEGNTTSAPYINGTLLPQFAHATDYRSGGVPHSFPAYIELEAGDTLGIEESYTPSQLGIAGTCHLVTWLEETGLTWKSYQEAISGTECPITDEGKYVVRHDPFVYFSDVAGSPPSTASARCIEHVRPYSELADDLEAGTVARYNFITPDLCNCGHDTCAPTNDNIRQEDDWLAAEIPKIQASKAYQEGGVILIIWDEGNGGDPPIGLIAVSPLAKVGYANTTLYPSHAVIYVTTSRPRRALFTSS